MSGNSPRRRARFKPKAVRLPSLIILFSFAFGSLAGAPLAVEERGTLPAGNSYAVLKPKPWNLQRALFLAPAQRTPDSPAEPALSTDDPLARALLAEGWLIATLAYRRPGIVLQDSVEDFNALRAHLVATHGAPGRLYVLGESVGGGIAVRLMENFPDDYAGALAVGGSFDLQEPAPTIGITFAPQRPVLLLPNQSESHAPETYARMSTGAPFPAVLWKIGRDGRSNTNVAEKRAALQALVRWVEEGVVPPQQFDATVPPPTRPSTVVFSADRLSATGRVTSIDRVRGDVTLDFQPADLEALGISRGSLFAVVTTDSSGAQRTTRVLYGQNLRQAKSGDWMALPEAEGGLLLTVFRGHAAAVSGLEVGAAVTLRRLRND
jgi:pimeloyl-ACP methyl ester carboxylesterase